MEIKSSQISDTEFDDLPNNISKVRKLKLRRSRLIKEGRDWTCKFCHKGYLSSSSLIFHVR